MGYKIKEKIGGTTYKRTYSTKKQANAHIRRIARDVGDSVKNVRKVFSVVRTKRRR